MSHVGLLATFVIRKCTHMTQPLPCEANGCTCTMCLMPPWRAGFALFVEKMFYQSATQVAFSQRQHNSSPAHSADTLKKLFSCAPVTHKPGQQPEASHSQDQNNSLSLQAATPMGGKVSATYTALST